MFNDQTGHLVLRQRRMRLDEDVDLTDRIVRQILKAYKESYGCL
jgi:hypothetical protein